MYVRERERTGGETIKYYNSFMEETNYHIPEYGNVGKKDISKEKNVCPICLKNVRVPQILENIHIILTIQSQSE